MTFQLSIVDVSGFNPVSRMYANAVVAIARIVEGGLPLGAPIRTRWRKSESTFVRVEQRRPRASERHSRSVRPPTGRNGSTCGSTSRSGSCPKRAQTKWHEPSLGGSSWHERAGQRLYQRLTSPLASSDNAEADGSIPSSPTKDLIKGHFWSHERKHANAEITARST